MKELDSDKIVWIEYSVIEITHRRTQGYGLNEAKTCDIGLLKKYEKTV